MSAALAPFRAARRGDLWIQVAILGLGLGLAVVSRRYPAEMPAIGPYDFSAPIYLATAFTLFWYLRGLARTGVAARPALWRRASFLAGVLLLYGVTQTGYDYLAQRMFFLNRIQHVALHHIGPVLIGLSMAGPVLMRGAPGWLRALCAARGARGAMAVLQQPAVAVVLFSGSFCFWLIPPVHFHGMIDPGLYQLMLWSMALDGILFWAMILDTRRAPPAHARFGTRAALGVAVMFPQILLGALITFAGHDIYPYYAWCGRYFPNIPAVTDQQIGGIVIWIPPAMMSALALIVVLSNLHRQEGVSPSRDAADRR